MGNELLFISNFDTFTVMNDSLLIFRSNENFDLSLFPSRARVNHDMNVSKVKCCALRMRGFLRLNQNVDFLIPAKPVAMVSLALVDFIFLSLDDDGLLIEFRLDMHASRILNMLIMEKKTDEFNAPHISQMVCVLFMPRYM